MKAIRPETLLWYCNTNEHLLNGEPQGIVIEVPGLGGSSCLGGSVERKPHESPLARFLAEQGILLAFAFIGPWNYMNRGAVRTCDEIVDCLLEKHGMAADCPVAVIGGSMGGLGSLIYAADSRHDICACISACPCYDVPHYFEMTPERARAIYSSLAGYDMPLEDALRSISPAHRIADMPHIPYFVVCDGADALFDADGMERFAIALDEAVGGTVSFRRLEGIGHGGFVPEVREEMKEFLVRNLQQ